MPVRIEKIFNDPTPDGFINQRYVMQMMNIGHRQTDMSPEEFVGFVHVLLLTAKKLTAVWTHRSRYCEYEDAIVDAVSKAPAVETLDLQHISYSQDLYLEMDEFLVQTKSTLDYMVKLPRSIIGNCFPRLHTFGDKGGAVIKALRGNVPDKWKPKAKMIEKWILEDHRPWLEIAIGARDKTNHYQDDGLNEKAFLVFKRMEDGAEKVHIPLFIDGVTARVYLEHTWYNLVSLVEQFTAGFLLMRLKPGLGYIHIPKAMGDIRSPIQVGPEDQITALFEEEQKRRQKASGKEFSTEGLS